MENCGIVLDTENIYKLTPERIAVMATSELETRIMGVYFLLLDEKIVYVGSSVNISERIATHVAEMRLPTANAKNFNKFAFIQVFEGKNLQLLEDYYITKFKPIENRRLPVTQEVAEKLLPIIPEQLHRELFVAKPAPVIYHHATTV